MSMFKSMGVLGYAIPYDDHSFFHYMDRCLARSLALLFSNIYESSELYWC